ncbi:hypothetical protein QFC22_003960 [Naganishia vaughanmartiniae]|uniref:Uncharacterized protein n=1 Tax=Naganishia vaughanmartiniae TaxID=1424756 RepID=A0ACC2X5W1_9TREE|nr:hypothetical protein QFC22_003960 [Naganishia vaughanmartiniae]
MQVRCEKGGLRRVLMNLIGNSLKFTQHGYVQVTLRALADEPINGQLPIEMGVIDTGKGISKTFLKEQLFHPFSQENPLQQGTGLGLAIVNSIVRSDSVNGKVDVWSSEGLGTEIRVSLNVEVEPDASQDPESTSDSSNSQADPSEEQFGQDLWVSLHNFDHEHRGYVLNERVVAGYAGWWGFHVLDQTSELGDIMICNEECAIMEQLLKENDFARPILVLTANRTSRMSTVVTNYIKGGGFAQMVFKPVGPERLSAALRAAVAAFDASTPSQGTGTKSLRSDYFSPAMSPIYPGRSPASSDHSVASSSGPHRTYPRRVSGVSQIGDQLRPPVYRDSSTSTIGSSYLYETPSSHAPHSKHFVMMQSEAGPGHLTRRRSEEDRSLRRPLLRPGMAPRSTTYHDVIPTVDERQDFSTSQLEMETESSSAPGSPVSTISLADGGVMLKISAPPVEQPKGRVARVLLVDDNHINLQLLAAYLKKRVSMSPSSFASVHCLIRPVYFWVEI